MQMVKRLIIRFNIFIPCRLWLREAFISSPRLGPLYHLNGLCGIDRNRPFPKLVLFPQKERIAISKRFAVPFQLL
jgi:hypothetical protein